MDLSGTWRAVEATDELRRAWLDDPAPATVDASWEALPVPGHWRSVPAFAASDGPLLCRTAFSCERPAEGDRWWLVFDGLFYQSDVWLDGAYVGDTEGYFFPHQFEVTEALTARADHVLGVEVTCSPQTDRRAKRNITGVFQHWDCSDPDANPGGIWRPVRLERSGPVRIRNSRVVCRSASVERAVVRVRTVLDAAAAGSVCLRTTVGPVDHEQVHSLAAGENRLEWDVIVPDPPLWWPHALGDQPLVDVSVAVHVLDPGAERPPPDVPPSDAGHWRTGLRQVRLRDWVCSINGERLFLKGANQGPARMDLAEAGPADLERDVHLALDAGLDLLRVHGHVSRPELYEAADQAGLLLWQDFPLKWGYARTIRRQAVRQAREMVDLLAHHPSIALWCAHNEPIALDVEPGRPVERTRTALRYLAGQELPSWNKTVLDRSVRKAIERADASRPVIAHSGVLPHPPALDGTDSHLYFGWYHGDERDLPAVARVVPRLVRFVSEFGAQAVPTTADFLEPQRWPDLDWSRIERHHSLQKAIFDERVPPARHASFEGWQQATQRYQADLVRHHVEVLRRLKYRPTGGFCVFSLADGAPGVTWSVLDHHRVPKAGYHALAEACRPVIVVADRPPPLVEPGEALALDVHVVSDRRHPLEAARAEATVAWSGAQESERETWRWVGDVPADACVRVGTVQVVVPDAAGPLRVDLTLVAGDDVATNRYEARIVRPADVRGAGPTDRTTPRPAPEDGRRRRAGRRSARPADR